MCTYVFLKSVTNVLWNWIKWLEWELQQLNKYSDESYIMYLYMTQGKHTFLPLFCWPKIHKDAQK